MVALTRSFVNEAPPSDDALAFFHGSARGNFSTEFSRVGNISTNPQVLARHGLGVAETEVPGVAPRATKSFGG